MKNKWIIFPGFLLAITLVFGGINCCDPDFWKVSAGQLLTPLCAICLTFFATQLKTDQRETKKHAEILIEKIQSIVVNDNFYQIPASAEGEEKKELQKQIQMTHRKLSNSISNLKSYSAKLGFADEVEYIRNEFMTYRRLVDENLLDFAELSKLKNALRLHAEKIDSKCDEIITKLYS